MNDLDQIIAELRSIRDRLQEGIDNDERIDLVERRQELHLQARQFAPVTKAELEAELARLDASWERLARQRIDVVKQAGDLAAGNFGFTSDAMRINKAIDASAGRDDLERRIRALRVKLADLGG